MCIRYGRAMAQAVSRRPLTAEARVRAMWNLWWTKWHWDRFFLRVLRFSPVNIYSTVVLHSHITWRMNNTSVSGSSLQT
jgi:hypothetical protein